MPELTSKSLHVCRTGPVVTIKFPSFEETGLVRHLFSTRRGGVSQGPYATMNLGISRGDDPDAVFENFRRICYVSGIYPGDMVFADQVHGNRVLAVTKMDRGKGLMKPDRLEKVDAMITNEREVCLCTLHADCVPVFLLDPEKKAIGLAHAGWRGTVKKIASLTVKAMSSTYGCDPADILAGIGPSIGPCCFEIRGDAEAFFEEAFPDSIERIVKNGAQEGTYLSNLWEANRQCLLEAGVKPEHITVTDLCTCCEEEYFFSYRRTQKLHQEDPAFDTRRGTMAAFLELI